MLFQTLVQLNILILATPALAGWIALPMAQPGVVRAACVVLQIRAVEAAAPKQSPAETRGSSPRHPRAVQRALFRARLEARAGLPNVARGVRSRPRDPPPRTWTWTRTKTRT